MDKNNVVYVCNGILFSPQKVEIKHYLEVSRYYACYYYMFIITHVGSDM